MISLLLVGGIALAMFFVGYSCGVADRGVASVQPRPQRSEPVDVAPLDALERRPRL